MLEIRPNCEACDKHLPADSAEAMICSYECTFCQPCVQTKLLNVCPNCGGGFGPRPIRPKTERRAGVGLACQPASDKRVNTAYSDSELKAFAEQFQHIPAGER